MNIASTSNQPQQHRANPAFKAYEIDLKRVPRELREATIKTIREQVGQSDKLLLPELKTHNAFVGFSLNSEVNKIIIAINSATEELKSVVLPKLNAILKTAGIENPAGIITDTGTDRIFKDQSLINVMTGEKLDAYTKKYGYYFSS